MKKIVLALICVGAYLISGFNVNNQALGDNIETAPPFVKGEELSYFVKYNGVKVGSSKLTFNGEKKLNGKKVYHITFSTKAPSLKDTEEIYGDIETFLPIEVHRKIGKKIGFNDNVTELYDQKDFRVDIRSVSSLRTKSFSIKKDSPLNNAILLTYFCRAKSTFTEKDSFDITLPTLSFRVSYKGEEKIKTPIGEYMSHLFISDPPHFKLWLSADDKKIPLMIQHPGSLGYSLVIRSIE